MIENIRNKRIHFFVIANLYKAMKIIYLLHNTLSLKCENYIAKKIWLKSKK